jgi:hypothetical protein
MFERRTGPGAAGAGFLPCQRLAAHSRDEHCVLPGAGPETGVPGFPTISSIDGLKYMSGQMYVEYQIPEVVTHPYPIVMIHGAAQTGSNLIATPDGQPGWASSPTKQRNGAR